MPVSPARIVWAAIVVLATSQGIQRVLVRAGVGQHVDVAVLAAVPAALAAVVLAVVVAVRHGPAALGSARLWAIAAPLGLVGVAVPAWSFTAALVHLSAGVGGLFVAAIPPAVAVAGWLVLGEALSARQVTGAVLACLGVLALVVTGADGLVGAGDIARGAAWSLVGVAAAVGSYLWGRRVAPAWPPEVLLAPQFLVAGVVLASAVAATAGTGQLTSHTPRVWALLGGLALVSYALPYLAMFVLLARTTAAGAAIANALTPVAAGLAGWAALGETPGTAAVTAGLVVIAGTVTFTAARA